ncbi:ornithine cyclodeaminase [Methylibium sp. T29-B]|uniref:hypothetical protein n=1 Tax=Methylibium sp. T29-B TaxID=1437443 RepID=UPI0003F45926|nr:hypothetical protein [Methylibium sp. T29-B]EWS59306.1 ornithine cyclodeaminase [Methylibium sp. T29-B]
MTGRSTAVLPVFDAEATAALLPAAPLVDAVADAMRARRAGRLAAPERGVLPLPEGGRYLVMPAADEHLALTKSLTVHPGRAAHGLPTIQGQVLVADARDGRPLMLLDAPSSPRAAPPPSRRSACAYSRPRRSGRWPCWAPARRRWRTRACWLNWAR